MISLILPLTRDEPALLDTLGACVSGVAEGVIRDAVLVTPHLSEPMEQMSDAAGCKVVIAQGGRSELVSAGAKVARSDWWLVLTPGMIPSGPWLADLGSFINLADPGDVGVTRLAARGSWLDACEAGLLPVLARLTGNPDPRLGLLMHRRQWTPRHRPAKGSRWVTLQATMHDRRQAR